MKLESVLFFVEKGTLKNGYSDTPEMIMDSQENYMANNPKNVQVIGTLPYTHSFLPMFVIDLAHGSGIRQHMNHYSTTYKRQDNSCKALMFRDNSQLFYIVENSGKAGQAIVSANSWKALDEIAQKEIINA